MSEYPIEGFDDVLPEEPNGEVVHWMAPRPLAVGPTGISIATGVAFAAGIATAVGVLAVMHWLQPPQKRIVEKLRLRLPF